MLDGILYAFDEFPLDVFEATNILPSYIGNFDNGNFAKSRWVGNTKRKAEVLHRHTQRIQNFGIDCILVQVNEIHLFSNLLHGSL